MIQPKKLTDTLGSKLSSIAAAWDTTEAAGDLAPLPAGTYRCRVSKGELTTAKTTGLPGYVVEFSVVEGDHRGRKAWMTSWLSPAAMAMTKRDLARLGITSLDQLERPLPPGIIADVRVVERVEDDGTTRNAVRSFVVVEIQADPTADPDFGEAT
jgi:hypothetical protein